MLAISFIADHCQFWTRCGNIGCCGKTNEPWSPISAPLVPPLSVDFVAVLVYCRKNVQTNCGSSEWTEARTDRTKWTKWEVIALCLSPLRVYVIAESIKNTMINRQNVYAAWFVNRRQRYSSLDSFAWFWRNSSQHYLMQIIASGEPHLPWIKWFSILHSNSSISVSSVIFFFNIYLR